MANGTATKVPGKAQVVSMLADLDVEADPRATLRELTALLVQTQAERLEQAATDRAAALAVAREIATSTNSDGGDPQVAGDGQGEARGDDSAGESTSTELEVHVPGAPPDKPDLPARNRWLEMKSIAAELATSRLLKPALRMINGNPRSTADIAADAMLILLTGHDLGLPPSTALAEVNIIEGTPSISAKMQRALIRRAGHRLQGPDLVRDEQGRPTAAVIHGQRIDGGQLGDSMKIEFTIRDAVAMGLCVVDESKPNGVRAQSSGGKPKPWESQTGAMLRARATSTLATLLFADVLAGVTYTPEELMPEYVWAESTVDQPGPPQGPQTPQEAGWEPMSQQDRERLNAANKALSAAQRDAVAARLRDLTEAGELPPRALLGAPHVERVLAVIAEVADDDAPAGTVGEDGDEIADAEVVADDTPAGDVAMSNAVGDDLCPECGKPNRENSTTCSIHTF